MNCPSLYTSPLLAPQSLAAPTVFVASRLATWSCHLCCKGCAHWLDLSAPSHLATWAHPLCCKGCVCWLGLYAMPLCSIPSPPSVWVHGPGAVNGLRSAAISVYGLPNPCFAWFSETSQLLFRPACEGFPFVWEPCRFRVHSLPWGTNSCPEVLCPLSRSSPSFPFWCFPPLCYLISGSLVCPPGGLGSSAVA